MPAVNMSQSAKGAEARHEDAKSGNHDGREAPTYGTTTAIRWPENDGRTGGMTRKGAGSGSTPGTIALGAITALVSVDFKGGSGPRLGPISSTEEDEFLRKIRLRTKADSRRYRRII